MRRFDVVVIGCGGVGSAALYHLAKRRVRVAGLDRFPPGHDRGSSHGESRIIRQAYFEHSDYVPLLREAYTLWDELSAESGRLLRHETGLLEIGPEDGEVVAGVLRSAAEHGLPIERLSRGEIAARYPGFVVPDGMTGVLERNAGYLDVEDCVRAHVALARGVEVVTGASVVRWQAHGEGFVVETESERYSCSGLIVTAGPWASTLLDDLGIRFEVRRKPLFWFESNDATYRADSGSPAFLYDLPGGVFYGFPDLGDGTVKVAEHTGGDPVDDPLELDRTLHIEDQNRLEDFLRAHLPGVSHRVARHSTCMYTMTADEHFIVDKHPAHERLAFAAGLSGHGFKFASVLGKVLADLVVDGSTSSPIDFLNCRRVAIRG